MRSNFFKRQLRSFTEQGQRTQKLLENRLLKIQLDSAYQVKQQYTPVPPAQPEPQTQMSQQEKCHNAQMNIQNFLNTTDAVQKRDIAAELQNELSMMREQENDQFIYHDPFQSYQQKRLKSIAQEQQQKQTELEKQQKLNQKDLELNQIVMQDPIPPFQDIQIVYKNEHFIKFTFLLASYLDLKSSCLFIDHYTTCMKLCSLAIKTLLGQSFYDYVNGCVVKCTPQNLYEQLLQLPAGTELFNKLMEYFKSVYRQTEQFQCLKQPLKKQTSFLQLNCSQNAYEQFFVTACFWKLSGGFIQKDQYDRFPEFY